MEAAVEHQPLDHVAGAVRPSDPAQHARAALAAADEHEVAHAGAAALHRRPRPRAEDRLRHEKAPALLEHRHDRLVEPPRRGPTPDRCAHQSLCATVSSATGSASSRSVLGSSLARTCGLMPLPVMIVSPSGR